MRVSEDTSGTLETVTNRGNITIQTLQKENRDAQERIIDLENRLRYKLFLLMKSYYEMDHAVVAWS